MRMTLFKSILRSEECLLKNELALNPDFVPKLIPFRYDTQRKVAECIKPLFKQKGHGINIIVFGTNLYKSAALKHILMELEEATKNIIPIYINCWQKNTSFKIYQEICDILSYKMTSNQKPGELFNAIKGILNKKTAVFVFDEIEKAEEMGFLDLINKEITRKCIILISADKNSKLKKRINAKMIHFKSYNKKEIREIIKKRVYYAFVKDTVSDDIINYILRNLRGSDVIEKTLLILKKSSRYC